MTYRLAILGSRGIPARYGGYETFAEELGSRLSEQGVEVTVYCEKGNGTLLTEYKGITLVHIPAPKLGPLTTIIYDLRSLWHARTADVVYMLGYGIAPFLFIPRLWGGRVWINVDGVEWQRAKWSAFAQAYFRLMEFLSHWTPNRILADAQSIKEHLLRRHKKQIPISVIPYGAPIVTNLPETSLLAEWGLEPDSYYLIVCRLEPENHIREMLLGFIRSKSSRIMIVLGNVKSGTPYVEELLTIKDPRIRLIGTVFDKAKLQALRCHTFVYCHGHSVGGTNPTLLEALGCSNAVLAHDNPFNREVAADAARYFADVNDFAVQIAALESDAEQVKRMRSRGHQIIAERYTWESVAQAYYELLIEDVGGRNHD